MLPVCDIQAVKCFYKNSNKKRRQGRMKIGENVLKFI